MTSLSGELSFATVEAALATAQGAFEGSGPVALDLAAVTRTDSAGLALLLELARKAREAGRELKLQGAPPQVAKLAQFFGIAGVLGMPA